MDKSKNNLRPLQPHQQESTVHGQQLQRIASELQKANRFRQIWTMALVGIVVFPRVKDWMDKRAKDMQPDDPRLRL